MTASYSLKNKCDICGELIRLCDDLTVDLNYKITPINDLLTSLLIDNKKLSFIDLDCVKENRILNSPLKREENKEISSFIYSLGKSDVKSQIKIINGFKLYLSKCEERYLEDYNKHKKLYTSLGVFIGLTISIILI